MVVKVELEARALAASYGRRAAPRRTHLENVMAQLEHNDVFHAQVILHEMHALCTSQIQKRVLVIAL